MTVTYTDEHRAPIVLMVMIHVHVFPAPFEKSHILHSPARTAALKYLLKSGCIEHSTASPCGYDSTPKGFAYVKKLCGVTP